MGHDIGKEHVDSFSSEKVHPPEGQMYEPLPGGPKTPRMAKTYTECEKCLKPTESDKIQICPGGVRLCDICREKEEEVRTSRAVEVFEQSEFEKARLAAATAKLKAEKQAPGTTVGVSETPARPAAPPPASNAARPGDLFDTLSGKETRFQHVGVVQDGTDLQQTWAPVGRVPGRRRVVKLENGLYREADGLGPLQAGDTCYLDKWHRNPSHPGTVASDNPHQVRYPSANNSKLAEAISNSAAKQSQLVRERGESYGDFYENHRHLGIAYTAIIEAHYQIRLPHIMPAHIAALIAEQMKTIRAAGPFKMSDDNYHDGHNYLSIAHECAKRDEASKL